MLVEYGRSYAEDLVQIIFDAVDHQFGSAGFSDNAGDDAVKHSVGAAAQAHGLADESQGHVAWNGLRRKDAATWAFA